jgi:hypothetical protein
MYCDERIVLSQILRVFSYLEFTFEREICFYLALHTKKSTLQNDQIARQIDNLVP